MRHSSNGVYQTHVLLQRTLTHVFICYIRRRFHIQAHRRSHDSLRIPQINDEKFVRLMRFDMKRKY